MNSGRPPRELPGHGSYIIRLRARFLGAGLCLLLLWGCQRNRTADPSPVDTSQNFLDKGAYEEIEDLFGKRQPITDAEKAALTNAIKNFDMGMDGDDPELSEMLSAAAEEIRKMEEEGQNAMMKRMMLAGQVIGKCAGRFGQLAPVPGEQYVGKWTGKCSCRPKSHASPMPSFPEQPSSFQKRNLDFMITEGAAQVGRKMTPQEPTRQNSGLPVGNDVQFQVMGKINGTLLAGKDGSAQIRGGKWTATLQDTPNAGWAKVKTTSKNLECRKCQATLEVPISPIPEKYLEGMRQAKACFTKALFLVSPAADLIFKGMDPKLRDLLTISLLGM